MSLDFLWDTTVERALALEVRGAVNQRSSDRTRYVEAPKIGWIRAYKSLQPKAGVDYVDLPHGCKVDLVEQTGRAGSKIDVFRLAESTSSFRAGSLMTAFWIDGSSQLSKDGSHSPPPKLVLDLSRLQLLHNNEVLAPGFTAPHPKNSHSPLIPTEPGKPYQILKPSMHAKGSTYGPLAKTWFRIETYPSDVWAADGLDGNGNTHKKGTRVTDRFLHCGTGSWGCATIGESAGERSAAYSAWLPVYHLLINSRDGSRHDVVGYLDVVSGEAH